MRKIEKMPLVAIKNLIMFPNAALSFELERTESVEALEKLTEMHNTVFITAQKDNTLEVLDERQIFRTGTISSIKKIIRLPGNMVQVVAQGKKRGTITKFIKDELYIEVNVRTLAEVKILDHGDDNIEIEAMMQMAREDFEDYIHLHSKLLIDNFDYIHSLESPALISDAIISNLSVPVAIKQKFLEEVDPLERLKAVIALLHRESEVLSMKKDISMQVKKNVDKHQKEYYLREHLKVIQEELGEKDNMIADIEAYKERMSKVVMPETVIKKIEKEISRLRRTSAVSQEGTVIRDYLDWVLDLPWSIKSEENKDIKHAEEVLDSEHYGLKKIKERIVEFLAVRQNTNNLDAPIMCLVGPPGVGKTSIAKSIATALNRKYVRLSLGGVHDEAEIRGHRKTYIGSMPGRLISSLKNAGESNPLILLDEIDKMGKGIKGDPTSALLEVLDREQNKTFRDNYLEVPYDISDVLFIATANTLEDIPVALRDRLDIVQLSSYTFEEKKQIANNFLTKKQLKKHGLADKSFEIRESALEDIITHYTKEAGVRQLERLIATLCRKAVKEFLTKDVEEIIISSENLEDYLGKQKYRKDKANDKPEVGVVRGLAWTSVGGDTLSIEVNKSDGKGKLKLTGNMGDVMKESAEAAFSFIRSNSSELNIDKDFYKNTDIHIHIPEGATPKDGPSAGITMATAMISSLTGRTVSNDVGMTGEITIRGKVLPIGGLKEKAIAAKRAGLKKVLIPAQNESDFHELEDYIKEGLEFVLVENIYRVLEHAFV